MQIENLFFNSIVSLKPYLTTELLLMTY